MNGYCNGLLFHVFLPRMDTWETEQDAWSVTVKVLQHHKEVLDSYYNANPLPDTPTKKRKLDHNSSPGTPAIGSALCAVMNLCLARFT